MSMNPTTVVMCRRCDAARTPRVLLVLVSVCHSGLLDLLHQIKQILTYKALLAGKRVETVSPENTSRMDCRTQSTDGCRRLGCRFYAADSRVFDADWNAAINIMNRYLEKRPNSFELPIDGKLNLFGRLCQRADSRNQAVGSNDPTVRQSQPSSVVA